ncbi:MAG: sugar phosphate nucleotidyltransferase, partial [Chthoniobacterales bacterium]
HQLRLLRSAGFLRIVLCVGYLGEEIEAYVGVGSQFGLDVTYAYDGATLRGTGGALLNAQSLLGDRFVVLYGDSYLPINYRSVVEAFRTSECPALMTVFRNEGRWDNSNTSFAEGRVRAYNKTVPTPEMNYIDYGVGVISLAALQPFRDAGRFDLADVYTKMAVARELAGFEVKQRFYEIGSRAGLAELDHLLRRGKEKITL